MNHEQERAEIEKRIAWRKAHDQRRKHRCKLAPTHKCVQCGHCADEKTKGE